LWPQEKIIREYSVLKIQQFAHEDVAVLGSGARVFFLAKAEIENWPILGNLAKSGGTITYP
jgi:hypothetical protein